MVPASGRRIRATVHLSGHRGSRVVTEAGVSRAGPCTGDRSLMARTRPALERVMAGYRHQRVSFDAHQTRDFVGRVPSARPCPWWFRSGSGPCSLKQKLTALARLETSGYTRIPAHSLEACDSRGESKTTKGTPDQMVRGASDALGTSHCARRGVESHYLVTTCLKTSSTPADPR